MEKEEPAAYLDRHNFIILPDVIDKDCLAKNGNVGSPLFRRRLIIIPQKTEGETGGGKEALVLSKDYR